MTTQRASRIGAFVEESNRIEGIHRVLDHEIAAHVRLLALPNITLTDLCAFVSAIAGVDLRERQGMNVRVGNHRPPPGGPEIRTELAAILEVAAEGQWAPYDVHCEYERLHPFMDGNGRSGRALWAWQMLREGRDPFALGFLHTFYYQALDAWRGR